MAVLIVEDAGLVSLDLAMAIEDMHGCPIPVSSVAQGLDVVATRTISAAILDGHLPDGEVTPLAIVLTERSIPFVVYTGGELSAELSAIFTRQTVVNKPAASDAVVAALERECLDDDARRRGGQIPGSLEC
jgi:DNA-binding NtrC family response regulator